MGADPTLDPPPFSDGLGTVHGEVLHFSEQRDESVVGVLKFNTIRATVADR